MNKIAFLVPIYPPHFWRAKDLLKSFNEYCFDKQADLWFIFTNEEEAEQFSKYENKIILPENIRDFKNNGIINIKKFYGIKQIKDMYDYIIVLDAESLFIKNINLLQVCEEFYQNKILLGNNTINDLTPILKSCQKYFDNQSQIMLSKYDNLYLWFNQLCIYKTKYLTDFFKKTNINLKNLEYKDFDFYIYMYYLQLYRKFKVVNIQGLAYGGLFEGYGFIPECFRYVDERENKYDILKIKSYHSSKAIYNQINNKNIFLLIQLNVARDDTSITLPKRPKNERELVLPEQQKPFIKRLFKYIIPSKKLQKNREQK